MASRLQVSWRTEQIDRPALEIRGNRVNWSPERNVVYDWAWKTEHLYRSMTPAFRVDLCLSVTLIKTSMAVLGTIKTI